MQRNSSPRRTAVIAVFALLVIIASAVPALAATSWQPAAGNRFQDEPRSWDHHDVVGGIPNGGGTGGQFPENGQAFATGFNPGNNTHYRYAVWTADRGTGNEADPLVPYGGGGNPQAAKDCTLSTNPATVRTVTTITSAATTLTINTSGTAHRFLPGEKVVVAGSSVAAYNGTWTVLANVTGTQFTATYGGGGAGTGNGGTVGRVGYCSVAVFARSITDRNVTTVAITAGDNNGGGQNANFAYYTTNPAHGLAVGDPVNVWGTGSDFYNIATTVVSCPNGAKPSDATHFCVNTNAVYGVGPSGTITSGTVYKGSWAWDGGGSVTGCATPACAQYGLDAYPVSPANFHVQTTSVAAAGPNVFVLYSTTWGYYKEMCQKQPRVMYVRTNTNYGAADAWGPNIQLSPTNGQVGYGTIGAGTTPGTPDVHSAYATWTDSETGEIKVAVTHNAGSSWNTQYVGSTRKIYDDESMGSTTVCNGDPFGNVPKTTPNPPFDGVSTSIQGFDGSPNIAGNGSQVGIIWLEGRNDNTTKVKAKISTNNGDTWPTSNGQGVPCVPGGGPACSMIMTNNGGTGWSPKLTNPAGTCTTSSTATGDSAGIDNCFVANQGVAATGTGATGRIGFLWADYQSNVTGAFQGPAGLYYREFHGTNGWGATRLAGCLDASYGACTSGAGTPLANVYNYAYAPSVALYGTSGVAYAASGCTLAEYNGTGRFSGAGLPGNCSYTEIFWRESGSNGTTWHDGCDGVNGVCDRFKKIANNSWDVGESWSGVNPTGQGCGVWNASGSCLNSAINDYASVVLDKSTGATSLGCASTGTSTGGTPGMPETGCKRIVFYLGRNSYYEYYRMYTSVGSAT